MALLSGEFGVQSGGPTPVPHVKSIYFIFVVVVVVVVVVASFVSAASVYMLTPQTSQTDVLVTVSRWRWDSGTLWVITAAPL